MPANEFYKPDNYHPQSSVAYLLVRNKSIFQRLADTKLAELGISAAQMSVLILVSYVDDASITSVSQLLGVNSAATLRVVHKLESMGLIKRIPSKKDGRVIRLSLTLGGKKLAKLIPPRWCDLLNGSLAGFTTKEFEQFKDFLARVEKNNLLQLESV